MVKVHIFISMVPNMKVNGNRTHRMGLELNPGPTDLSSKVFISKVRSTAKENTYGAMRHNTMETGRTITFTVLVYTIGLMAESSKVIGKTTTCMEKESTPGKTAESTKESTFKIKSMDMVFIDGPMEENTMENGKMENSMEKVNMCSRIKIKEKVFGKMVIEANGPLRKSNINKQTVMTSTINDTYLLIKFLSKIQDSINRFIFKYFLNLNYVTFIELIIIMNLYH